MRVHPPTSHARVCIRLSPLDVSVAVVAPVLALYLRNAFALSGDGGFVPFSYCLVSLTFSLIAFVAFRIHGAIPRYLSVDDILSLAFAVLTAELLTCVVLFTFTRLDGIPRSVPAIHALILGAGLLAARALVLFADRRRAAQSKTQHARTEHVIVIGLSDVSVPFMKFLEAMGAGRRKIVGALDENPRWFGRSVSGVRVFGPPAHLNALISEFATHGVDVDHVVIGVEIEKLSEASVQEIRRVCAERHLELVFVPQFFAFGSAGVRHRTGRAGNDAMPIVRSASALVPSAYFRCRRAIDFLAALLMIAGLAPLWIIGTLIALFDVGTPVLFWQQRIGVSGRTFQLYKLRTLRPAFGRDGARLSDEDRLSAAGRFLRRTRLDELPQLLNVLVGDMGLIGPRPLLPQDQPPNPSTRLAVRPGITGWAQVNGGTLLSPSEKDMLDRWYVANASLWVDLRIVAMTFLSLVKGDRRPEPASSLTRDDIARRSKVQVSTRFVVNGSDNAVGQEESRSAIGSL